MENIENSEYNRNVLKIMYGLVGLNISLREKERKRNPANDDEIDKFNREILRLKEKITTYQETCDKPCEPCKPRQSSKACGLCQAPNQTYYAGA